VTQRSPNGATAAEPQTGSGVRATLRLGLVATAWLVAARLLARYGVRLLPLSVTHRLTLQSYLALVQLVSTLVGLGLAFALLASPRRELGLRRPAARSLGLTLLWAPVLFVVTSYLAIGIALPTLRAELEQGGRQLVERNGGEFGQALVRSAALLTLLWGVLLAPVAEELAFRGPLWSALARLGRGVDRPPGAAARSLPPELLSESWLLRAVRGARRWLASGGAATLGAAALFAWMHADEQGGAGIVRVVSTACLGLGCGLCRQASGSVLPGMLLHALFNLMALAQLRRWVVFTAFPRHYTVPTLLTLIAGVCLGALLALHAARWWRQRRT
jgi:membrane protease YdiL (CAAX protease family)